ncbi:hypothetical protein LOD99_4370 [Oopsacas minuta]|uniref:Uncharacterized protein n=1 Tax=Oopsacas minuta TaxID=111878 RepID=A0AAV7JVW3_9METZ|nr:hypothetical protein LOD99_4370 [Oopsacas minuta]
MNENIGEQPCIEIKPCNKEKQCFGEEDFPLPPPESDWRLGKYFDAMNNIEGCPEPPEFEEIEGYLSNCTDTDMDESASVLYAYNYLKEYVQHMKSARQAKTNLMAALPSPQGQSPSPMKDSDTSPNRYQNTTAAHRGTPSVDDMEEYDHLSSTKEESYYASMNIRPDYNPQLEVRRTLSDGPQKIAHKNGYAIPYITRYRTSNLHLPIKGMVSYPNNIQRREQAEIVEICSPSDTSMCSTPYWLNRPAAPGRNERIVYESVDKLGVRQDSDEYFLPRTKDKQSNSDSSNSHHHQNMTNESNRTIPKRRKFKRPNNRSKIYVTTNTVFNQPIIHSKQCLDSLNSDEVRPCDCLKTVVANQKNKQQTNSPLKNVHVMESIQDGEISNFTSVIKKKLNRTRGVDDWAIPCPHSISSDNTYADDFNTYDRTSNHEYITRSFTSYNSCDGTMNDTDSLSQSYTHIPYNPNKENFQASGEEINKSPMYMPNERWNFAFVPYNPTENRPKACRFHSIDTLTSSDNRSVAENFRSDSSFVSKNSSKNTKSEASASSSCSSRGSSLNNNSKEHKPYSKSFFKSFSPKFIKSNNKSPVKRQVSEL